ncbi:MAG: hypothetical protein IKW38_00200 [Kiritimatiellae bacterium]|nr:hypothetical protein [Kiritimatiellia bacterium]
MMVCLLIALVCLAIAYLWTSHCRHMREDEYHKMLHAEIAAAEAELERCRREDPNNLTEHKRLRAKWLSLVEEHNCLHRTP